MSGYIPYEYLQELGPYGIKYVCDMPKTKKTQPRQVKAICPECGKYFVTAVKGIKSGNVRSCGCYKKKNTSKIFSNDLTGQKINHLTIMYRCSYKNSSGKVLWHCKCDCGRECDKVSSLLKTKRVFSCGNKECQYYHNLQAKQRKRNLLGQKFGKLTVIEETNEISDHHNFYWKCQCECGKICYVESRQLISGTTKSCGCTKSFYENKIADILLESNIKFVREKTFPECRNPETNYPLRFDFYFPDYNLCLEYNGKQHYESCGTRGWNTPEALIKRKKLDEIKIQFCKTHNINIIVIPYWDCNKITSEYLFNLINNTNDDDSEDDIFE